MQAYVNKKGIVTIGAKIFISPIIMNPNVTTATTAIEYNGTLFGPLYKKKYIIEMVFKNTENIKQFLYTPPAIKQNFIAFIVFKL